MTIQRKAELGYLGDTRGCVPPRRLCRCNEDKGKASCLPQNRRKSPLAGFGAVYDQMGPRTQSGCCCWWWWSPLGTRLRAGLARQHRFRRGVVLKRELIDQINPIGDRCFQYPFYFSSSDRASARNATAEIRCVCTDVPGVTKVLPV